MALAWCWGALLLAVWTGAAAFPGLVRVYDADFDVFRCTGVFVTPTVVLTAGQCVLAAVSTAFIDGIQLQPESQPQLEVQAVRADGSYETVGELTDSVYHFHGPVAGWNVGLIKVRFTAAAAQFPGRFTPYPVLQQAIVSAATTVTQCQHETVHASTRSQGFNFTGVMTAIGPYAMSLDAAGRVDMPSGDVVAWHRQQAADVVVTDVSETDAVITPDVRCPEYAPGDYIIEYVLGRDGREINRAGICLNFGERGAPLLVRRTAGMAVFPASSTAQWVVAGVATRSPNDEAQGHNYCNDLVVRASNLVAQRHWLREKMAALDPVNAVPTPFVCPSVSPSPTASATPSPTPSASPSLSPSPSPSNAPPPLPATNFGFIFAMLGLTGVVLMCAAHVALRSRRAVRGVTDKARTVGRRFKRQVSQLPPRVVPPDPEAEKERIAALKADVREAQRKRAQAAAGKADTPAAVARAARRAARDAAAKAAQAARAGKQSLAAARYESMNFVKPGAVAAGSRIAFDPGHAGVDSANLHKQADLLKRSAVREAASQRRTRRGREAMQLDSKATAPRGAAAVGEVQVIAHGGAPAASDAAGYDAEEYYGEEDAGEYYEEGEYYGDDDGEFYDEGEYYEGVAAALPGSVGGSA